jgi:MerR family transcriptional regulator, light-induced transcriptional regulator
VSSQHRPCSASDNDLVSAQIRGLIDGVLLASVAEDPARVRTQLDAGVLALGLGGCIDAVLLPAMREIGIRWQHGDFAIESERLMTETVRGWLETFAPGAPEPRPTATVLLACGPSDRHSLGLEALGMLLRYQKQPCRMLGPRTSIRTLTVAATANRPSGIVVVSHLRTGRLGATQALRSVTGLGVDLFYAGSAFATGRLRRHVPGTYLGTNIQAACTAIVAATMHST